MKSIIYCCPFMNSLNSLCSCSWFLISLNFSWAALLAWGARKVKITKNKAIVRMEILIDFLKVLWMTASWPLRVALQASMACFLIRPTRRKLAPIVSKTIGLGPTRLASLTEPIRTNMPNMKVQSLMLHAILCKEVFWTAIFSLSSCFK